MSVPRSPRTRRARPPGSRASTNSRCSVRTCGQGESGLAVAAWWAAASTAQVALADMGGASSRASLSAGAQVVGADLGRPVGLRQLAGPVQAGLKPAVGLRGAGQDQRLGALGEALP